MGDLINIVHSKMLVKINKTSITKKLYALSLNTSIKNNFLYMVRKKPCLDGIVSRSSQEKNSVSNRISSEMIKLYKSENKILNIKDIFPHEKGSFSYGITY